MTKFGAGEGPIGQCYSTLGETSPKGSAPKFDGSRAEAAWAPLAEQSLNDWRTSQDPRIVAARAQNAAAIEAIEARRAAELADARFAVENAFESVA